MPRTKNDGWPGTSVVFLDHFASGTHFMNFHKEVAREFARRGITVLWFNAPIQPRHGVSTWLRALPVGRTRHDGMMWNFAPWGAPTFGRERTPIHTTILIQQLKRALRQARIERPAVFVYTPAEAPLLESMAPAVSLYWMGDEAGLPGPGQHQYLGLMEMVDLIPAVSQATYDEVRQHFPTKVVRTSTGVPFEEFRRAAGSDPPQDVRRLTGPIAGYAGSLVANRMDLELLRFVIGSMPETVFLFVGPADDACQRALSSADLSNVRLLGERCYQDMPRYINTFAVGLIPYQVNDFNRGCDPLKMYEYLALEKSVVSTRIPAAEQYPGAVQVANDERHFVELVRNCLESVPAVNEVRNRVAIARAHTISGIARELSEVIEASS